MHQEERIKHRLCLIDFEDAEEHHIQRQRPLPQQHNNDISDWMNSPSTEMNKTTQQKSNDALLPNYKKLL